MDFDVIKVGAEVEDMKDLTKDESFENSGGVCGLWWDVQIQSHWFFVHVSCDTSIMVNMDCHVHERDSVARRSENPF